MFTNNYIKMINGRFFCRTDNDRNSQEYRTVSGEIIAGFNKNLCYSDIGGYLAQGYCRSLPTYATSYNEVYPGVHFGSGGTAPAKSDYALESPITSGLSITNPTSIVQLNDGLGKHEFISTFSVTNTTENEITIREIGVITPMRDISTSGTFVYPVLMERTVLPEPVTISAGRMKVISYKIVFNHIAT